VAPSLRRRRSRTIAFLENSRGTSADLAGLDAVLVALAFSFATFAGTLLASFLGGAAFLAAFGAFVALFFWLAPFFEDAFSGATFAPCSATAALLLAVAAASLVMVFCESFLRRLSACMTIHHFHEKAKSSQDAVADFLCFLAGDHLALHLPKSTLVV